MIGIALTKTECWEAGIDGQTIACGNPEDGGGIGRYVREWNLREIDGKIYDSWGWYWDDAWK